MNLHKYLPSRVRQFLDNEAGNYAIIFALTVFPIMGAAGLAVDYSNLQRHRGAVQNALDAAALATAKEFSRGVEGAALQAYAEDFFEANLPEFVDPSKVDISVVMKDEEVLDANGEPATVNTVLLDADLEYDSYIAPIMGHDRFDVDIASQVALGNITVEVALVMDNSGSMNSNGRISLAKSTAKDLVASIFNAASNSNKPNPVSFSLVPFSGMVNVGTANANASWMDTKGWSPIHHENLDWANTYITSNPFEANGAGFREKINGNWQWKSRFDVFDMLNVDWQGCVEMRPWPHNTLDTAASTGVSSDPSVVAVDQNSAEDDRKKLFIPFFAPSEPYRQYAYERSRRRRTSTSHSNDWYNYGNDYLYDWVRPKPSNPNSLEQIYYDTSFVSPYDNGVIQSRQNLRQDWVWRYQAVARDRSYSEVYGSGTSKGPNYGCYARPIKELTTSQSAIANEINGMSASGMTNIQLGLAWGWRTLSPSEPFTGGREPGDETNRKYMIVLTDGNNTYSSSYTPNETYFGAWGYGKQNRIEDGLSSSDREGTPYVGDNLNSYEKKMNVHTVQTCNNAKADGVTIFTIAFDVSDGSSVKEMLQACSGTGIVNGRQIQTSGIFYYDVSGDELQDAMASIASQISEMRILR